MRNELIDCIKGFLIILVVVGHVIYEFEPNPYGNNVFKFCYSFHMFLFIGISGYLVAHKENNIVWLKKRFKRLIIPFIIWSSVIIFFWGRFQDLFFMFTDPVLWYLIVLFCCDLLLYITNVFNKRELIVAIILVFCINLFCLAFPNDICKTVKMLAIYCPFYFAGWLVYRHKYNIHIDKSILTYVKIVVAIIYPISMIIYGFKDRTEASRYVFDLVNLLGFNNSAEYIKNIFLGSGGMIYNHLVVAPLGCIFAYLLCKTIVRFNVIKNLLLFVGKYTLQIYVLSCFFVVHVFSNNCINELVSILLGVAMPILLGVCVNKNKVLNKILFGI